MQLPFTQTQFFDVLAAYNSGLWPAAVALWALSLILVVAAARANTPPHRALSALLAFHWAWSALAFHAVFFTSINPAAWLFAAVFLVQAGAFVWVGVIRDGLRFSTEWSLRHVLAGTLVTYAFAYPFINAAEGLTFPRMPTFGLPCPTTLLTAGLLLVAHPQSWHIRVIPVLWSVIGGSAALVLGVRSDAALLVAGTALVLSVVASHRADVKAPGPLMAK